MTRKTTIIFNKLSITIAKISNLHNQLPTISSKITKIHNDISVMTSKVTFIHNKLPAIRNALERLAVHLYANIYISIQTNQI